MTGHYCFGRRFMQKLCVYCNLPIVCTFTLPLCLLLYYFYYQILKLVFLNKIYWARFIAKNIDKNIFAVNLLGNI